MKWFKWNEDLKLPLGHKCCKCETILLNVFECLNVCERYCNDHLPNDKKCESCKMELQHKQNTNNFLEFQKIDDARILRITPQSELQNWFPQNCGQKFVEREIQKHLKEECIYTQIECTGCLFKYSRGAVMLHQLDCKYLQIYESQIWIWKFYKEKIFSFASKALILNDRKNKSTTFTDNGIKQKEEILLDLFKFKKLVFANFLLIFPILVKKRRLISYLNLNPMA